VQPGAKPQCGLLKLGTAPENGMALRGKKGPSPLVLRADDKTRMLQSSPVANS